MEDRFFFNPYGFNPPFGTNLPPNMMPPPNFNPNFNTPQNPNNKISPKEFYENQYYYYRYLNEALDYQIKSYDYADRMSKNFNNQPNKSV